jgi:hypothetical protein
MIIDLITYHEPPTRKAGEMSKGTNIYFGTDFQYYTVGRYSKYLFV